MQSIRVKLLAIGSAIASSGIASADCNGTFCNVTDVINDVVPVFGALLSLVIAAVPILITLGLVGFLLGFFDGILEGVSGKIRGL